MHLACGLAYFHAMSGRLLEPMFFLVGCRRGFSAVGGASR